MITWNIFFQGKNKNRDIMRHQYIYNNTLNAMALVRLHPGLYILQLKQLQFYTTEQFLGEKVRQSMSQ